MIRSDKNIRSMKQRQAKGQHGTRRTGTREQEWGTRSRNRTEQNRGTAMKIEDKDSEW
jgi:hypothetical protein